MQSQKVGFSFGYRCRQLKVLFFASAWMNAWRDWVKKPSTSEEPHAIDLRPFLCEHVGLKFDFDFPDDRKNFEIVYEDEWHALKAIYKSKAGLELVVKQVGRGQHKTRPKLCEPCRKLRRLAFVKIEIGLKFLDKDEDMDAETDLPRAACEYRLKS